jgi:hypothetical protein
MACGKTQKPADASKLRWLDGGLLTKLSAELSGFRLMFCLGLKLPLFDDLSLVETAEAGSFDCRDVDKHIFAAALRLNKPVPLLRVEPLHGTFRHICSN